MPEPDVSLGKSVAWDDIMRCIAEHLWELAPQTHQDAAHMDITFLVTMQDLLAAIEQGIEDAYEKSPSK